MTRWLHVGKDGLAYLDRCLSGGKTLSKLLRQRIADATGITNALVPENVELDQVRRFETGGLLPQADEEAIRLGKGLIAVAKPNLVDTMAQTITRLLKAELDRICLFEE